MPSVLIIARRELASLFLAPIGYVLASLLLFVAGITFWWQIAQQAFDADAPLRLLFAGSFFWIMVIVVIAVLTMRLVAGEKADGTFDLLLSAPVGEGAIVVAKFLAAWLSFAVLVIPTTLFPLVLNSFSHPPVPIDWGPVAGAALVMLLTSALFCAVGIMFSCLTRSQTAAGLATFAACSIIFFAGHIERIGADMLMGGPALTLVPSHYALSFAGGLVDTRPAVACLTGAALALVAAIQILQWSRFRAARLLPGMLLVLALMAALVLMVNHLGKRHYLLADWTGTGRYTLASKTRQVLKTVDRDVEIKVLCRHGTEAYAELRRLLAQFMRANRRIRVEFVDPDRELARAAEIVAEGLLARSEGILIKAGTRRRDLPLRELLEGGGSSAHGGRRDVLARFRAEQALAAAIMDVMQDRRAQVYFLAGCGEHEIDDFREYSGYAAIARAMRRDNLDVRVIRSDNLAQVPADCDVLVIAGPRRPLGRATLTAIAEYMARQGHALVLMGSGSGTGLETLFEESGVVIADDRIIQPAGLPLRFAAMGSGRGAESSPIEVTAYGKHPITNPLQGIVTTFYRPRSLQVVQTKTGVTSGEGSGGTPTILAASGPDSWGETDPQQQPPRYDAGRDRPGPLPVAVAVEKGAASGIRAGLNTMRLVLVGDSTFAANGCLSGGNQDFFLGALHWLLRQETLIGAAPRQAPRMRMVLNERSQALALLIIIGLIPGGVLGFGLLISGMRRIRS